MLKGSHQVEMKRDPTLTQFHEEMKMPDEMNWTDIKANIYIGFVPQLFLLA